MAVRQKPIIDGEHREFAERFQRACEWAGLLVYDKDTRLKVTGSYAAVAKRLGVTKTYVGQLYRGQQFPSGHMGSEIAIKLGVSPNWLLANLGPMAGNCLVNVENLTPPDQELIRKMIESMERKSVPD